LQQQQQQQQEQQQQQQQQQTRPSGSESLALRSDRNVQSTAKLGSVLIPGGHGR